MAVRSLPQRLAADLDSAFPAMVVSFQDALISGVRPLVGAADAADVVQETLIRAHRALGKYPSEQVASLALGGWLWTIALNVSRNWARSKSRRVKEAVLATDRAGFDSSEESALELAMLTTWSQRLAELSAPQREAVVLRHVVDLPYHDIAAATGRPLGTVKTDVRRGLAALRQQLTLEDSI